MKRSSLVAGVLAVALCGFGSCSKGEKKDTGGLDLPANPTPAPPMGDAASLSEADIAQILPGVPLDALTLPQKQVVAKVAQDEFCFCGCPHTLSGCLREHKGCHHAPKMAALAARLAAAGATADEIIKNLTEYYASFDASKRKKLDVKDFGPPGGLETSPISLVEFSDFT